MRTEKKKRRAKAKRKKPNPNPNPSITASHRLRLRLRRWPPSPAAAPRRSPPPRQHPTRAPPHRPPPSPPPRRAAAPLPAPRGGPARLHRRRHRLLPGKRLRPLSPPSSMLTISPGTSMRIISRRFLKIMVKSSMWSSPWIGWSIFPVGMDMLSSRIELMQRRLFFTWMVAKLMEMLLKSDSRFHHSSKELLLLQKLFTLHQKGMWLIIIKLVLVLKRPPNRSPGNPITKKRSGQSNPQALPIAS
uniref:Uncharacterized protein n=1 Tax=Oryza glumipatula TaxID=40148 RepID=A0A0D9ZT64_9ORYZ